MSENSGETTDEKTAPSMTVAVERLSDIERKLDVEIPWDEVNSRLDEAYRELKQGVAIKGFRKGKVPRRMLERLFGKHVVKEVAQRLVQESIPKALTDNDISPVSEPKVDDEGIKEGECFKYTATMQIVPEVEPRDYFGVDVEVTTPQVSDEAVELALQRKQQELTDYKSIEGRVTAAGDVMLVDVMGKVGDEPIDIERQMVELGDMPREPLAGLAAALTGIPCDKEELDLELDLPAPGAEPGKEGPTQKARLLVTIHEASQKVVPELDDDFAKDTGDAETLDELRGILREKLEEEEKQRLEQLSREDLIKSVVEVNDVPVVPALVERHLERRVELQKALMGMQMGTTEGLDEDAMREALREEATLAVKRALMLSAIGKKEEVEVQEADLEKRLAEIAGSRGQNVARVRSEYEKDGLMDSLRERLTEDKTLDLLMSKANIITKESSEEPSSEEAADAQDDAREEAAEGPSDGDKPE